MYPAVECDTAGQVFHLLLGGKWQIKYGDVTQTALLVAVKGEVKIWNGFSFTQPLKECRWAAEAYYTSLTNNKISLEVK
jgi:hypothetical protein